MKKGPQQKPASCMQDLRLACYRFSDEEKKSASVSFQVQYYIFESLNEEQKEVALTSYCCSKQIDYFNINFEQKLFGRQREIFVESKKHDLIQHINEKIQQNDASTIESSLRTMSIDSNAVETFDSNETLSKMAKDIAVIKESLNESNIIQFSESWTELKRLLTGTSKVDNTIRTGNSPIPVESRSEKKLLKDCVSSVFDQVNINRVQVKLTCCNEAVGGGDSYVSVIDRFRSQPTEVQQLQAIDSLRYLILRLNLDVPDAFLTEEEYTPWESCLKFAEILRLLKHSSEETVQEKLREEWILGDTQSCGIDASKQNFNLPLFQFPDEEVKGYPKSAKCDFLSYALPMFLEIKPKGAGMDNFYWVHRQCVERVVVTARVNELLTKVISFATIGEDISWCFVLTRRQGPPGDTQNPRLIIYEDYSLYPIPTTAIRMLWSTINRSAFWRSSYFVHDISDKVGKILFFNGFHPGYCQIKMKFISHTSCVLVVVPGEGRIGRFSIPPPKRSFTFTIKLSLHKSRGEQEVVCLNKLRGLSATQHMIATLRCDTNNNFQVTWFNSKKMNVTTKHLPLIVAENQTPGAEKTFAAFVGTDYDTSPESHYKSRNYKWEFCWWNFYRPRPNPEENEFTAIISCTGEIIKHDVDVLQILSRQLREIHEHGVLHTDLRRPNLLQFDVNDIAPATGKDSGEIVPYHIIDYDLAVDITDPRESVLLTVPAGARRAFMEDLLKYSGESNTNQFTWTARRDQQFLKLSLASLVDINLVRRGPSDLFS